MCLFVEIEMQLPRVGGSVVPVGNAQGQSEQPYGSAVNIRFFEQEQALGIDCGSIRIRLYSANASAKIGEIGKTNFQGESAAVEILVGESLLKFCRECCELFLYFGGPCYVVVVCVRGKLLRGGCRCLLQSRDIVCLPFRNEASARESRNDGGLRLYICPRRASLQQ